MRVRRRQRAESGSQPILDEVDAAERKLKEASNDLSAVLVKVRSELAAIGRERFATGEPVDRPVP